MLLHGLCPRPGARESQRIPGDACSDCAAALCCTACVPVQMDATVRAAEPRPMYAPDAVGMAGGARTRARVA